MSGSPLALLQRRFARAVADPGAEAPPVRPGGTLTREGAVGVYRTAYPARLTEQLGETFEAVWSVLGDEDFFRVCREYILRHPSRSYNLSDYGEGMPEFLGNVEETGRYPFLPELARFEWIFKELFHQKEHAHAAESELKAVAAGSRLVFGAAVRLLRHSYPVAKMWSMRKERPSAPHPFDSAQGRPFALPEGERVCLFKRGGEIYLRWLEAAEFKIMERIREGASVEAALDPAELDQQRAAALFGFLGESEIVEGIR